MYINNTSSQLTLRPYTGMILNTDFKAILKKAENYTYLTFAHLVLKPLPASGRGLERGSILSEVLNRSQYKSKISVALCNI